MSPAEVAHRILRAGQAHAEKFLLSRKSRDIPAPRLAVSPVDAPNAFAAGTSPQRARIVVTDGLRARLDPGELEAVLGHELSHIVHRDAFVVTAASLFPTAGAYLGRWRFGASDYRGRKRDTREWIFWPVIMVLAITNIYVKYLNRAKDR